MDFTITFAKMFFTVLYLASPILVLLCALIVILGQIVGRREGWSFFNTVYWTFITALTVGYGDMRPVAHLSKTLSILIAALGIMLTGVIVAVTVATASNALRLHMNPAVLQEVQEQFEKEISAKQR
jgi:voltage-gated potassium channel